MGSHCSCLDFKGEEEVSIAQNDFKNKYSQNCFKASKISHKSFVLKIEEINKIIKIQAIFLGLKMRKRFRLTKTSSKLSKISTLCETNYSYTDKTIITEEQINQLIKYYPYLDDGVIVVLRKPVEYGNGAIYYGEWNAESNQRHGRGIQSWIDGSLYEGYWVRDKANLLGKLIHTDGDMYFGEWLDDKAFGIGTYFHSGGAKYEGEWKEDKQEGLGRETWSDGSYYEGQFRLGMKNGIGIFKWGDFSEYEGEFFQNNIHGIGNRGNNLGVYRWSDSRTFYGQWRNNKMDGNGVFIWPDGRKYRGDYKNDKKDGYGEFEWHDGRRYIGQWKNGKQHGQGEFLTPKEQIWKKGTWREGIRILWHDDVKGKN